MRARSWLIAASIGLIISAAGSLRSCDAGFVLLSEEVGASHWQLWEPAGAAAPASQDSPRSPTPSPVVTFDGVALGGNSGSSHSSGAAPQLVGGAYAAALPQDRITDDPPVIQRLLSRESISIPLIALSSVFRPPRV